MLSMVAGVVGVCMCIFRQSSRMVPRSRIVSSDARDVLAIGGPLVVYIKNFISPEQRRHYLVNLALVSHRPKAFLQQTSLHAKV